MLAYIAAVKNKAGKNLTWKLQQEISSVQA